MVNFSELCNDKTIEVCGTNNNIHIYDTNTILLGAGDGEVEDGQTITLNYESGYVVANNLTADNIKEGIEILGVTGTMQSGSDITANIKVTNSISDIMGTERNKLCILNDISGLAYKVVDKIEGGSEEISALSEVLTKGLGYSCCSSYGNNIYIFGGYNGNSYNNTIYNFSVTFNLTANNVLIYNANSNYSFDLITDQVTIPIKNVYIGDSNNTARLANAYLYDETQTGWVNVNTGEVLTEVLTE